MNITLQRLKLLTRQTTETIVFSSVVSFFHGPVSTGKSTIAQLIDYCLGGDLERTPAIRQEFVAVELAALIGPFSVQLERGQQDSSVRVTWSDGNRQMGSVNAPLDAGTSPLFFEDVFNLSDLLFKLAGVVPIKVRRSKTDPDSPLVRLSFRDVMWYCYLKQDHLDSSFYRLEDTFKRLKSQDVMRFFTGLYSDRLNELDVSLARVVDDQRTKRESVVQIRRFMVRFQLGSELDLVAEHDQVQRELGTALEHRTIIEHDRSNSTHLVEPMRRRLRDLSDQINSHRSALHDLDERLQQRVSLRAELLSAKIKSGRADEALQVFENVEFAQCPKCSRDLMHRRLPPEQCSLCCQSGVSHVSPITGTELEVLRRGLNERIDELDDSIDRQQREVDKLRRSLSLLEQKKSAEDQQLAAALTQYDSAYVASVRAADREVAKLQERLASLARLREMPAAIADLEHEAGALQGDIDRLKTALADEKRRLVAADRHIALIASTFHQLMMAVQFPGVSEADEVVINPRNWQPIVRHGDQEWSFFDAGSGGKKTLFNVCYALAVHTVAAEQGLPVPTFLIIDSPTKNISDDENPELVSALYHEIYKLATRAGRRTQFILIDSDLVEPDIDIPEFEHRRMAGEPAAPRLIPYYEGP